MLIQTQDFGIKKTEKMHINGYLKKKWAKFRLMVLPQADNISFLEKCCIDNLDNAHDFEPVISSRFAQVRKFMFKDRLYFYKKYISRDVFEPVKNLFRGDRAIRALKGNLLLSKNGFNAPRCVLTGKKGNNVFNVSEAVQGGIELNIFFWEEFPEDMNQIKTREKRDLCKLLGKLIGKMHAKGIAHGDLRWGNVMIVKAPLMANQIWFLDNERTSQYSSISQKKRIVNLVQMNLVSSSSITSTDRMRFYLSYLMENPTLVSQKKILAQKVLQKTAIRLARKAGYPAG